MLNNIHHSRTHFWKVAKTLRCVMTCIIWGLFARAWLLYVPVSKYRRWTSSADHRYGAEIYCWLDHTAIRWCRGEKSWYVLTGPRWEAGLIRPIYSLVPTRDLSCSGLEEEMLFLQSLSQRSCSHLASVLGDSITGTQVWTHARTHRGGISIQSQTAFRGRTCLYAYSKEAICNRCCETGTCRVWPGPEFYLPCRVNDLCMTQAAWLGRADGCVVGGDKSQGATEVTELNSRVISNTVVSLCCGV